MKNIILLILSTLFITNINSQSWTHIQLEYPSPYMQTSFGTGLAMDSTYTIVGAPTEFGTYNGGSVSFYENDYIVDSIILKQKYANPSQAGKFGSSVAISGNYAVVGNCEEALDSVGQNSLSNAGAAYVYKLTAGVWSLQQKIVAIDRGINNQFGYSVAISNERILIGLGGNSNVYCFLKDNNGVWYQSQKIVISNIYKSSVSIDGINAVIGVVGMQNTINSTSSGIAFLYKFNLAVDSFLLKTTISPADGYNYDNFGSTVSIVDTNIIIGAPNHDYDNSSNYLINAGAAYLYSFNSNYSINLEQKLFANLRKANAEYGSSVSIYDSLCSIGAPKDSVSYGPMGGADYRGAVYIYKRYSSNWTNVMTNSGANASNACGSSVAINNHFQITASLPFDFAQSNEPDGFLDIYKQQQMQAPTFDTTHYVGCFSFTDSNGIYYDASTFFLDTSAYLNTGNYHYYDIQILSSIAQLTVENTCPPSYISPSGNYIWSNDGVYYDTIYRPTQTCDSIIKVELSFDYVDVSVIASNDSLIASDSINISQYQWLDCNNNYSKINNATSRIFVPNTNGNYAVQIRTTETCLDTSTCFSIVTIGISDNDFGNQTSIYPNPSKGIINIRFAKLQQHINLTVENMLGAIIINNKYDNINSIQLRDRLTKGVYVLKILSDNSEQASFKVIVE